MNVCVGICVIRFELVGQMLAQLLCVYVRVCVGVGESIKRALYSNVCVNVCVIRFELVGQMLSQLLCVYACVYAYVCVWVSV